MFTFTQMLMMLAGFALWGGSCLWIGCRLGASRTGTPQPFTMPSLPDWIRDALPEKQKPPEDESLNPTWQ